MIALLVILVLSSGYIVISKHPKYFYRLHRHDGQIFYVDCLTKGLRCLFYGLSVLLLISFFSIRTPIPICNFSIDLNVYGWLVSLAKFLVNLSVINFDHSLFEDDEKIAFYLLVILFMYLYAYGWVAFSRRKRFKNIVREYEKAGVGYTDNQINEQMRVLNLSKVFTDPLDKMLIKSSIEEETYLLITLKNNKVYVGKVSGLPTPHEKKGLDQDVSVIPIISGYRESESHQINFTTDYTEMQDESLGVVFKREDVFSVCVYSEEVVTRVAQRRKERESKKS